MLAVIKTGGKQYIVKPEDTLYIEKLDGEVGSEISFDNVLLVASEDGSDVKVGTPLVTGAKVSATIEQQGRAKKLRVTKYKRKTRYKRVIGHRQHFTKVKIGAIA